MLIVIWKIGLSVYNSFYYDETKGFYPYLPFHNLKYRGILIKCEIKEYWALTLLYITIKIGLNFLLNV